MATNYQTKYIKTDGYHPLGLKLMDWAEAQGYSVQKEERYYIIRDQEYYVLYTKTSHKLQCYYEGYGKNQKEVDIQDYNELDELLDFIESSRDVVID